MFGGLVDDSRPQIPLGLEKIGERYGSVLVVGKEEALQAYAKARNYLSQDPETHSEFMQIEDGHMPKYEPLSGEERPNKRKFTVVMTGSADDFRSHATDFMQSPEDIKAIFKDPRRKNRNVESDYPDYKENATEWAVHQLLKVDVPLETMLKDYQVALCQWNYLKGSFVSPAAPHFQTPSLALKHEMRHIRHKYEQFMRHVESRRSTDAGTLTNREELITIREENRIARILGEAVRTSHSESPDVDMPDTTSVPEYLNGRKFVEIYSSWLDDLQRGDDAEEKSIARIKGRSILQSHPGLSEYRKQQIHSLQHKRLEQ